MALDIEHTIRATLSLSLSLSLYTLKKIEDLYGHVNEHAPYPYAPDGTQLQTHGKWRKLRGNDLPVSQRLDTSIARHSQRQQAVVHHIVF
ncbi:MAG: hypothetical protein NPIRA02_12180 [Nitrospirales bacterium]|nr:MAG: hypothetical protein NPIRA02_12180 [Nitrospirales bacterium]